MKTKLLCAALVGLLGLASSTFAQLISPVAVKGTGLYAGNAGLIADGVIPAETYRWDGAKNVRWALLTTPTFTLDYGANFLITDVLLSVDNNDRYAVDYSLNGSSFKNLFTVLPSYGEISASVGGMDTMSTDRTSPEYVSGIDFSPITARYLRIRATGGDGFYAVGELEAFGSPVPEPSTYGLIGAAALAGLIFWRRRARR